MLSEIAAWLGAPLKSYLDIAVLFSVIYYAAWYAWNLAPKGSPPGKRGLPLIGAVLSLGAYPERIMASWSRKYGPVCLTKMGLLDVVIVGGREAAHEAYVKSASFGDRPSNNMALFSGGFGILMLNSGDFHLEQRRFSLHTLREFGMGRRSLEPRLVEISNKLCDQLGELCIDGKSAPIRMDAMLYDAVSNIISQIVFGYEVARQKKDFRELLKKMVEPDKMHIVSAILMVAPFLRWLPIFAYQRRRELDFRDKLHRAMAIEIEEHATSREPGNPRDFVDSFLDEMENANNNQANQAATDENDETHRDGASLSSRWKPYSSFSKDQLIQLTRDFFMASTDTTSTSISWIILFLSKDVALQRRVQAELDDVFGQSGVITMRLMDKLPYLRAVIQETNRIRPSAPLSFPHVASRSDTLMGYKIPKGAMLITNIFGIHHDERLWPDPDRFLPERHLDKRGRFVPSSNIIPFNVGSRSCLGQQLAKMQLFAITASLFRRFDFHLEPGQNLDMRGTSMVSLRPPDYKVRISNHY